MTVHRLKTDPSPFEALWLGYKTFEVRLDDRGFALADVLVMEEWVNGYPTGREVSAMVSHILQGGQYGVSEGWVVMSLRYLDRRDATPSHPQAIAKLQVPPPPPLRIHRNHGTSLVRVGTEPEPAVPAQPATPLGFRLGCGR